MNHIIRNFADYQQRISAGSMKIPSKKYPFFCFIVGSLSTKVQNVNKLIQTLELCQTLKYQSKLTDIHFFQILDFLYEKPERLVDTLQLLRQIKNKSEQQINIIEELQSLFQSQPNSRKLGNQPRYNSIDTVVVGNQEERQQNFGTPVFQGEGSQQLHRQNTQILQLERQIQQINKMSQDEEFARMIQQQEQELAKREIQIDDAVCQICYVDLYEGEFSLLQKCSHIFHRDCLVQSFRAQIIDNNFPLKCPNQECKTPVADSDIKLILTKQLFQKYESHTLKSYADTHGDSVSWCPTADCGYMFFFQKQDQVRFQCLQCKKDYCLNCRVEWHKDMTCKQYKVSSTTSEDDLKFMDFVKGKKFKQCPKCKFWVQKNQGCDHMTCKCKFQFCYKCGGVYMKCQCVQKQKQQMQRRQRQAQQRKRKKQQRMQKLSEKKPKTTRATRQKKK